MKIKYIILLAWAVFFLSCSEWKEMDKSQLLSQSVCSELLTGKENINNIRHHLDHGKVEFIISDFTIEDLSQFDDKAKEQGWCIVDKIKNQRLYTLISEQQFINGEIITVDLDDHLGVAYITISNNK